MTNQCGEGQMSKKGIILAGGRGTRLHPITKCVPKSLVPIYDKPTIYYPLTTLIQQKCDDILVICCPEYKFLFEQLLGDGSQFKIKISYLVQNEPKGIADAFIIGEKFINNQDVTLILGDNVFIGDIPILSENGRFCTICTIEVKDASQYGAWDEDVNMIYEKPTHKKYNRAIPGLYWFDECVSDYAKLLIPSKRGELEITDLIKMYDAKDKFFDVIACDNNVMWFDTGNFEDLADASNFIRFMKNKFGKNIGDPYNNIK